MEEEAFRVLTRKIDLLSDEVKKLNAINNPGFKECWLTSDEVCTKLDISKRTLQKYRDEDLLPFSRVGKKIYYKASDVEKVLEANVHHRIHS